MCGIAGFVDYSGTLGYAELQKMTDALIHRGPDGSGYSVTTAGRARVGLGHRRLSIIDLSESSSQPMTRRHLEIIYNGEIYNFREIKKQLSGLGHKFSSSGDTEVILAAFEEWGESCVDRFIGMFAFAIFSKRDKKLWLFRDRTGVKPLYFFRKEQVILFGSEMKSLMSSSFFPKDLNYDAIAFFMQQGYIPAPATIFKDCWKLTAGNYLRIDLEKNRFEKIEYWNVRNYFSQSPIKDSDELICETIEGLLTSAFEYRMVADVPVGVFLSGGYDSTTVAAILQKKTNRRIKTFTIGFSDHRYDESGHARKIANFLGTEHYERICTPKEAVELIPEMPLFFDEPFGDSSAIPTMLVSKMARDHVTVALSADGGDETFAGYTRYQRLMQLERFRSRMPASTKHLTSAAIRQIKRLAISSKEKRKNLAKLNQILLAPHVGQTLEIFGRRQSQTELNELLSFSYHPLASAFTQKYDSGETDTLNRILAIDYQTYLADDILTKVDRATMSVSLEGREPLLDHRIIEYVASISGKEKMQNNIPKHYLKKITHKYVPKDMMNRPKMGFGVPIMHWLKDDMKDLFMDTLSGDQLRQDGLFSADFVEKERDNFICDSNNKNVRWLWFLFCFQMWKNEWL